MNPNDNPSFDLNPRKMLAQLSTTRLIELWEESEKTQKDDGLSLYRGWLMDELEKRNKPAFDCWLESHEESPRVFFIGRIIGEQSAAYQLNLLEWKYAQQLTADDFSPMVADAAGYYSILYPDMRRRQKGKHEASYFIVYRRSDGEAVFESSTYDELDTCNQSANDVTADYIENGEEPITHTGPGL